MKIGIVGCGLNSDYHINFARAYPGPGAEIVGVVDKDERKAKQCMEKFGITNSFSRIADLVDNVKPDVIHIVTPPMTHFALAAEAIEAGCHVLIEKPMTLNLEDGRKLFDLADRNRVMICSMHNHFFDPCMIRARELIESGRVGKVINVESYYGLNTRIDAFRRYPVPNVVPWLYDLPGGVFHDFMAHPLYVMLPYVGESEDIQVIEKAFGELPQMISDELRILIRGDKGMGVLTFSFAAKPHHHFVRIYGTKMMVNVNFDTMTTTIHPVSHLPKAAQKATYNLSESWQLAKNTISNVWNFGTGKLRPYQGMKILIHQFYDAINNNDHSPVLRAEALKVLEVMDKIWPQIKNTRLCFDPILPEVKEGIAKTGPRVFVTGSTGFLGTRLIEKLSEEGFKVRALARKLSNIEKIKKFPVEIIYGDVGSVDSLKPAFEGVDIVVHAAADTAGREEESETSTIRGTQNVIDLSKKYKVKKLVYISSCSVYGVADYAENEIVTEESSLERFPEKRGFYSYAKLKAEELVTNAMKQGEIPIVCLRPGTIFGPGGEVFTPMMGFSFGEKIFAVIGSCDITLPLVYIDNLCGAITTMINRNEGDGETFNIVDSGNVTKQQYIEKLIRKLYPQAKVFYFPLKLLHTIVWLQEWLMDKVGRDPFLTRYRLISSQRKIVYDSSKIVRMLGWTPPVTIDDGINAVLNFEQKKSGNL
jgi:predicted dehydrogenase/nucleoside-diphosphate-sugar epimerase